MKVSEIIDENGKLADKKELIKKYGRKTDPVIDQVKSTFTWKAYMYLTQDFHKSGGFHTDIKKQKNIMRTRLEDIIAR